MSTPIHKQMPPWSLRAGWLILFIGSIWLWPSSSAHAVSYGGISLEPGGVDAAGKIRHVFNYVAAEGEEIRDTVELRNTKLEAVQLVLFPSGYSMEKDGLHRVEPDDLTALDPGYWVTFDRQEVVVNSKSTVKVGFTVKVPPDADVGEHVGAILVTEGQLDARNRGGSGMQVVTQVGSQLTVHVPGDVNRTLLVNKVQHAISTKGGRKLTFTFNLSNQGNVALRPSLSTNLRGIFGGVGTQDGVGVQAIGRGQTLNVNYDWSRRAPYFGRFVANFTFHLGEYTQINKDRTTTLLPDQTVTAQYVFWVLPLQEAIFIILFLLLLYLLRSIWLYIVILRRLKTKTQVYQATKDDTLMKIAAKFGADPRVLAKFNLLRWPYEIRTGDELLIPLGRFSEMEWRQEHAHLLDRRELFSGVIGHLFARRNIHTMARHLGRRMGLAISAPSRDTIIVERGDTVADVAKFAHTDSAAIIKLNHLRPPYRLRVGQELLIPKPKTTKRKTRR